jgi:hypothetical protein
MTTYPCFASAEISSAVGNVQNDLKYVIFILFGSALLMSLIIFVSRIIKSNRKRRVDLYNSQFRKILNSIIVNETYSTETRRDPSFEFWLSELGTILGTSRLARKILIDEIIAMKKNLVGDSARAISAIYHNLHLETISLRKLESLRWEIQAAGIRELTEMDHKPAIPKLLKLLHSTNRLLKEESLVALIRLETRDPLKYLNAFSGNFSLWMQINIHHHFQSYTPDDLPDFKDWLNHANNDVRTFGIQMALHFRQISAIPALAKLLTDKAPKIQAMAIKALTELEACEHLEDISRLADTTAGNNRVTKQIMKAFAVMGDQSHMGIVSKFANHPAYLVRFEAVRALRLIGGKNCEALADSAELQSIIDHLSEPLLE